MFFIHKPETCNIKATLPVTVVDIIKIKFLTFSVGIYKLNQNGQLFFTNIFFIS